ncbi:MAG TPA: VOC family protein [Burkholderiales bacterium]|nr:VOC family protein [Burkholderiales bacterium]
MPAKPKPIPDDYRAATPYLCVKGAAKAIDFYVRAFGAKEQMRMQQPDGRIGHAEVRIGAAPIMLADEFPDMEFRSPQSLGGSPVNILVYVEDVDALVKRAVAAGATVTRPVADQFYGDRLGSLKDPFGHSWSFATRIENLSAEEIRRRAPKAAA